MTVSLELGNIKVQHPKLGNVYLELAKVIVKGKYTFISGIECTSQCEAKGKKIVRHLIQYGKGVKVIKRLCDRKYATYFDAEEIEL